jgi:hypothetical protein
MPKEEGIAICKWYNLATKHFDVFLLIPSSSQIKLYLLFKSLITSFKYKCTSTSTVTGTGRVNFTGIT